MSAARNKAIELSTGKLLAFIDADDFWEPNHLQVLYDLYIQNPEAGIFASRYAIKMSPHSIIYPSFKGIDDNYSGIVTDYFGSSLKYRIAFTSAVAVPKEVFKTTGVFNTSLTRTEDTEMWLRIVLKYPVAISNKVTAKYNYHLPKSLSKVNIRKSKVFDINSFSEHEDDNKSLKIFLDLYRMQYAMRFKIEGDIQRSKELFKQISPANINIKAKLLFKLPPFTLRLLLQFKHWLHKVGIVPRVYD